MDKIYIFDTTLRDGEQAPGASLNPDEKLKIAHQLKKLNVDVIEAGFPYSSEGDFEAVKKIAKEIKGICITALARARKEDIKAAYEAIKFSENPRIHTFIATSEIHMKYKLKMTPDQVLEAAVDAVKYAKSLVSDVEFSAEDASRSDWEFLCKIYQAVIDAGATVINVPDTVGYAVPEEFGKLIAYLRNNIKNIDKAIISVHCHDDLGLAVANSISAILNGARQIECTINGLGERAGNAALEEIVMILKTRRDFFNKFYTDVKTEEIYKTSRLVSSLTGIKVQKNKAIVGENAFAHESGIHQDGILKEKLTYEIIDPKMVGFSHSKIILGKHSGRHAFSEKLKEMGYELKEEEFEKAFLRFKKLADKKKFIYDEDIEAIIEEELSFIPEVYKLKSFHISSGTNIVPTATVAIEKEGEIIQDAACGDGPVDAAFKAIDRITGISGELIDYSIKAVTGGKDAVGEVILKVKVNDLIALGKSARTDIVEASVRAYLNAINKAAHRISKKTKSIKGP